MMVRTINDFLILLIEEGFVFSLQVNCSHQSLILF